MTVGKVEPNYKFTPGARVRAQSDFDDAFTSITVRVTETKSAQNANSATLTGSGVRVAGRVIRRGCPSELGVGLGWGSPPEDPAGAAVERGSDDVAGRLVVGA